MVSITWSEKDTLKLGRCFSQVLNKGDVVVLQGPLGVGKTTFVKGVLEGLGVKSKEVLSPSFIIIREYKTKKTSVYHLDFYRIEKTEELFNLGYRDYLYSPRGISLIEWGEKVEHIMDKFIKVKIDFLEDNNSRRVEFSVKGYPEKKLEGVI